MPTSPAQKPLSSHPAFPAAVAVWFAALLGGGTFVLPAAIFESVAVATGLSEIVPAAQPPLGDTARLAISLAAAAIGALLGLFIAWQVRRAAGPSAADIETFEDSDPLDAGLDPSEVGERTAWQVWREHMADEDSLAEPEPADPVEHDWAFDEDDAFVPHDREDEEPVLTEASFDEAPEAEPAPSISDEDDPQRAEADRLVAGLARMRRDGGEAAYDPAPVETPAVEPSPMPLPTEIAPEPDEDEGAVEPPFLDNEQTEEVYAGEGYEPEPELDQEPEPEPAPEPLTEPSDRPPLAELALPDLVSRLESALAARRRGDGESSDAVVAFLRREANRVEGDADEEADAEDPQAMLRTALDKLDQTGRSS